jgi:crotonobetainyl-CoA:carnitine CoA-transferase CaiB-like acyl-CoA transferase
MQNSARGPLDGIVVVDLSRALAGPHAAMMLGDLGARVIKLEHPDGGDDTRGWGPPFVKAGGAVAEAGDDGELESTYFFSCNRNKESVTADLKSAEGRALLTRLVRQADVVVENFRTGVLDRLGFSMEELHAINSRLVVLSITGFGHDGPEGGRAGYDQIAQGEGGLMSLTGNGPGDPMRVGVPIGDLLAGMYGAYGVVAALHERNVTGRGTVVRTSLLAAIVGVHAFQGTRYTVAGEVPHGQGNHHPSICPYGLFHCSDGMVQIAVGSQSLWRRLAAEFGLPADEKGFATNAERVRNRDAVVAAVDKAFAEVPLDELLARLAAAGIPSGQVRTLDHVYGWDQTRSQGLLVDVEHASVGPMTLPGPPLRFDGRGGRTHQAPPTLGQHDASVREWLDEVEPEAPAGG